MKILVTHSDLKYVGCPTVLHCFSQKRYVAFAKVYTVFFPFRNTVVKLGKIALCEDNSDSKLETYRTKTPKLIGIALFYKNKCSKFCVNSCIFLLVRLYKENYIT